MPSDTNILQNVPDNKPVRIFLPLLHRPEHLRIQGLYLRKAAPKFSLLFKAGVLPVEQIDIKTPCIISIDMGGPTISLEAMIQRIADSQTLEMIVRKSMNHEQLREFFRVDAVTSVISQSLHTGLSDATSTSWSSEGRTVDISGSGILAIFKEKPRPDRQVQLEITIPSLEPEIIRVLAHQIRMQELHDGRVEVAYHFDDITTEDRDKIIGCCLNIQRKMLRLKVTVKK